MKKKKRASRQEPGFRLKTEDIAEALRLILDVTSIIEAVLRLLGK
ncbi:MAG: hypothetical protein AABN33_02110 [Acidobacteriota bacterium]